MIRKYKLNNSYTTYVVYSKKKKTFQDKKDPLVGQRIYSRFLGWGTIVSVHRDLCTIKYGETKIQCYKNNALDLIERTKAFVGKKIWKLR